MAEEDPELERDLMGEDAAIEEGEDIQMEEEFADEGGELDLPEDDEEVVEENEDDLKGEETDSDLEEYYRELGIETEEKGHEYKKKKKVSSVTKKQVEVTVSKEEARQKVLNDLITKTREQPTYTSLTRVIKIVKQVFFTNNVANENEGGEEEKKKPKKDKINAIAVILQAN